MMGSISAPAGSGEVYALLAMLSDPEAYKARLDKLAEDEASAREAIATLTAMTAQAAEDRAAAETARAEALSFKQDGERVNAAKAAELQKLSDGLAAREMVMKKAEDQFVSDRSQWDSVRTAKEEELASREAALAETEAKAAEDARVGAELRSAYEKKLAAIKAATGE